VLFPGVKREFSGLYARAFCHSTEDLEKVKRSMTNALGDVELKVTSTEGYHGNPILLLNATVTDMDDIVEFFSKLGPDEREIILETLGSRLDDSCNLFVRLNKQAAFKEDVQLESGDDVISIRIHVNAFPARSDIAREIVKQFLNCSQRTPRQ